MHSIYTGEKTITLSDKEFQNVWQYFRMQYVLDFLRGCFTGEEFRRRNEINGREWMNNVRLTPEEEECAANLICTRYMVPPPFTVSDYRMIEWAVEKILEQRKEKEN